MSRSISANLQAALAAYRTRPIWLVEIALSSTVRYTTWQSSITYNSNAYTPQDFNVDTPSFGNDGSANAGITFQGVDETFTALFRQGDAEGSTVKVWITDNLSAYSSADDAVQVVDSTVDSVRVTPSTVSLLLARQPIYQPAKRVDYAHGFTDITGAGVTPFPGGNQVLV